MLTAVSNEVLSFLAWQDLRTQPGAELNTGPFYLAFISLLIVMAIGPVEKGPTPKAI